MSRRLIHLLCQLAKLAALWAAALARTGWFLGKATYFTWRRRRLVRTQRRVARLATKVLKIWDSLKDVHRN